MKSLIKYLINLNFVIQLRNTINILPIKIKKNLTYQSSTSDAFMWRTDNNFTTKFKFSDILKLYFKIENSHVELHFYSKFNELITIKKIYNLEFSNEVVIDKNTLGGIEDYGVFYAYHIYDGNNSQKFSVNNKCYVGFSKNKEFFSFVHGNTLVRTYDHSTKNQFEIIQTSLIKNNHYIIQKFFRLNEDNELFFANPSSKLVNFDVNGKNYQLKRGHSKLISINENLVKIRSNCFYFRPIAFSYDNNFFDVYYF